MLSQLGPLHSSVSKRCALRNLTKASDWLVFVLLIDAIQEALCSVRPSVRPLFVSCSLISSLLRILYSVALHTSSYFPCLSPFTACVPLLCISFECLNHFALATLLSLAQFVSIPKLVTSFYNFGCFAFGVAERRVDRRWRLLESRPSCGVSTWLTLRDVATLPHWPGRFVYCELKANYCRADLPTDRPRSDLLPTARKRTIP